MINSSTKFIEKEEINELRYLESQLLSIGVGLGTFLALYLYLTGKEILTLYTTILLVVSIIIIFSTSINMFITNIKGRLNNIESILDTGTWLLFIGFFVFILESIELQVESIPLLEFILPLSEFISSLLELILAIFISFSGAIIQKIIQDKYGLSWSNYLKNRFPYLFGKYVEEKYERENGLRQISFQKGRGG